MYHSHLPYSPRFSVFARGHYLRDLVGEAKVLIGADETWSPDIRSIHTETRLDVLEYSHDGTMLAAGAEAVVWVFRAATGERMAEFHSETSQDYGSFSLLSFSADDRILAVAQYVGADLGLFDDDMNNCVALWDIITGTKLIVLPLLHRAPICTITFNPENSQPELLLSIDESGLIVLWNIDLNSEKAHAHHQMIRLSDASQEGAVSWIPGPTHRNTVLVGFQDGHIEMRDVVADPNRCLNVFRAGHDDGSQQVVGITVSGDGCWFASHLKDRIIVHNIETGDATISFPVALMPLTWTSYTKQRYLFASTSGSTTSPMLAFADGEAVSLSFISHMTDDHQRTNSSLFHLQSEYPTDNLYSIALSPNGQFIALSYHFYGGTGTIKILDTSALTSRPPYTGTMGSHESEIGDIRFPHFSPDGRFVVSSSAKSEQTITVWTVADSAAPCQLDVIKCHALRRDIGSIVDIIFLSDSRYILSVDDRGDLDLWDREHKQVLSTDSTAREFKFNSSLYLHLTDFCRYTLFPFTDGTLGFSLSYSRGYMGAHIFCWVVETNPPGLKPLLVNGAQLPNPHEKRPDTALQDEPLCIYRQISDNGRTDTSRPLFELIVEYQSTRRFSTPCTWEYDSDSNGTLQSQPEWTEFGKDRDSVPSNDIGTEGHLLVYDTYTCVGPEIPILLSDKEDYIMSKYGKKLFLIPPAYRGPGRWHEKKLLLWNEGRMLLLDFSQVNIDEPDDVLF